MIEAALGRGARVIPLHYWTSLPARPRRPLARISSGRDTSDMIEPHGIRMSEASVLVQASVVGECTGIA